MPYDRRGAMQELRVNAALEARVPKILLRLLVLIAQLPGVLATPIDVLEVFAGRRRISKAMRCKGYRVVPFDRDMSHRMDINTDEGFCILLGLALSLAPGGLLWLAPVCSSWIWINAGTHTRNQLAWSGNTDHAYIAEANKMVTRCALLIWLVRFRGCSWVIEQPRSSVLIAHDRLQEIVMKTRVWWTRACMGAFRGTTLKPLQFWSGDQWISELSKHKVSFKHKFKRSVTYKTYMNKRGAIKHDGKQAALKKTQSYTRRFGRVIANIFEQNWVAPATAGRAAGDDDASLLKMISSDDRWEDAQLDSVFAFLQGQSSSSAAGA